MNTSSTLEIPLNTAGKYRFFVIFEDKAGNKMLEKDFYEETFNDPTKLYNDYIFEFEVYDDSPLSVTASNQGKGYVGTQYKASAFKIDNLGYNATYSLYYSETKDATEDKWVEIVAKNSAVEGEETNGYTYEQLQEIGYDGLLTFTPDKIGYYKIVCTINSTASARWVSAEAIVSVQDQTIEVHPYDHWIENNIWSVVFLSVGTVSLILVVILLFIKPKDEIDTAPKKNK